MIGWNDERVIAFDFETTGTLPEYALQPWRRKQGKFWATSISVARHNGHSLVASGNLNPTIEDMEKLLSSAIAEDKIIVGWNTAFDISVLLAYGLHDLVYKAKWLDGMLLWRHLIIEPDYEGSARQRFGLKHAVATYIPAQANYADDIEFHGDLTPKQLAQLQAYNDRDTAFTWIISKHIWGQLSARQRRAALIEASTLPLVAHANLEGMMVDLLAARELQQFLADQADYALTMLHPIGVDEATIRSPAKLRDVIYGEWGVTPERYTPSGQPSTDQETLVEMGLSDPRVAMVRRYRDALLDKKKYAETPIAAAEYNGDDRSHPLAITFGTYSGRFTYSSTQGKNKGRRQIGTALHQVRRDARMRGVIVAPPGYTLMEFDAAGQEFRWMALASGDPTMLSLCQPGEDPHSYMGAAIVGMDYKEMLAALKAGDKEAKTLRQLGKVANLSLQYRTSAKKLRMVARVKHGIDMSESLAAKIHGRYQDVYKRVPDYWASQIAWVQDNGYVETFAGRRVVVKGDWRGLYGWSMGSTAINYRIQGTGADQKYLALATLKHYLRRIGAQFAWDLHDGIYFYVPDEVAAEAASKIRQRLNTLPYEQAWGFKPSIPLPWDCKVGKSWGDLREWHPT